MSFRAAAILVALVASTAATAQEQGVRLYAAGSLRAVMTELAQAFAASGAPAVSATFGASGLLRERIEKGEPAEVFASADLGNPLALSRAGRARRSRRVRAQQVVRARRPECRRNAGHAARADARSPRQARHVDTQGRSLGRLRVAAVRKGGQAAPGGVSRRSTRRRSSSPAVPESPPPPADRSIYGVLVAEGKADIFLTYCTNAVQALREVPGARMLAIPEPLAVGASYGMAVMNDARPAAQRFALFVLSIPAQETLARHGFTPVGLP